MLLDVKISWLKLGGINIHADTPSKLLETLGIPVPRRSFVLLTDIFISVILIYIN